MLCKYCSSLSIKLLREGDYLHQPNFSSLLSSAQEGCPGCHIIQKALTASSSSDSFYADSDTHVRFEQVKVYVLSDPSCINWLFLRCRGRNGLLFLATDDDDPAAQYIDRRVVEKDPASEHTYRRVRRWVGDCVSKHLKCRNVNPGKLPTRVLEVPPLGAKGEMLRLYISSGGESDEYVALSYCWGIAQPITTTLANLESHKVCIREDILPKTMRDAISVTRELGIRFLWVDALCIIQDSVDGEDWQKESSKMSEVYSNAFVTISADIAKEASEGFLSKRVTEETDRALKIPYYLGDESQCGSVYLQVLLPTSPGPLSSRAWAFQERKLSTRVLDYQKNQTCLTCRTGMIRETDSKFGDALRETGYLPGARPSLLPLTAHGMDEEALLEWYRGVEDYSRRQLTYENDKLPALSGYAHAVHSIVGGTYLAGVWKDHLLVGLSWSARSGQVRLRKPLQTRAPSWSWAAIDGGVDYNLTWIQSGNPRQKSGLSLALIEASVNLSGSDIMGQVTGGWLKVSGFIKKATWLPPDPDTKHSYQKFLKFARASYVGNWDTLSDVVEESNVVDEVERSPITSDGGAETLAYCLFDTEDVQPKVVWCIALVADRGLVLDYLPQQDVYQRVGFFVYSEPVWMSNCPVKTITIV